MLVPFGEETSSCYSRKNPLSQVVASLQVVDMLRGIIV
jgi:hypothetical protein